MTREPRLRTSNHDCDGVSAKWINTVKRVPESQEGSDAPNEISTLDDLTRTLQTSSIAIAFRRTTPEKPPGEPPPTAPLGEVKSLTGGRRELQCQSSVKKRPQ